MIAGVGYMSEFSKPLQVYVVEDSPVMLRMLASTIEAAGAELVGHSKSAQRAINEIFVLEPDLILIDISLSRGNGFDVLRLLRYRGVAQSARKVVLTNHEEAEYRALSFRLGADQFYEKSFDMLKVLDLIRAMAVDHVASTRIPVGSKPESHRRP
jgi:DNA-binding NarL/FixJ family response regulator